MKSNSLKYITISLKVFSAIAGLAVYNDVLPGKYAVLAGLVFAVASIAKDSLTKLGDLLDDGEANESYKG